MSKAAPRYAKALLEALTASGEIQSRIGVLQAIANLPESVTGLLGDSTIPVGRRTGALLSALGSPAAGSILSNFVALLGSRRRLGEVGAIARELLSQIESRAGIVRGTVRSREALTPLQLQSLERALSVAGTKVELGQAMDPSILGGFRVQLGSTVVDATANNQLNQARRALLSA